MTLLDQLKVKITAHKDDMLARSYRAKGSARNRFRREVRFCHELLLLIGAAQPQETEQQCAERLVAGRDLSEAKLRNAPHTFEEAFAEEQPQCAPVELRQAAQNLLDVLERGGGFTEQAQQQMLKDLDEAGEPFTAMNRLRTALREG
jgi:hypothetical protein